MMSAQRPPMAASLAERRRTFTEDWMCTICHELPIAPFQTPCGHCMCVECATKLAISAGGKRKCPTCSAFFSDVLKQPLLSRTLDGFASLLWPDVWAFWEKLRVWDRLIEQEIFNLVSRFIISADDDTLTALRLFRFSVRYGHDDYVYRSLYLEPLLVVEAGGNWDGYSHWLNRVMDKAATDPFFLFMSTAESATPAHAQAAPRLIPLLASATAADGWTKLHLQDFSEFAQAYIGHVNGRWSSLIDAEGFTTITPAREIATLVAATPTPRLLNLLTLAVKAQFDEYDEAKVDAGTLASSFDKLDAVVSVVAPAIAALGSAAGADIDLAALQLASALYVLLPVAQASELLRRHSFFSGFVGAGAPPGPGVAAAGAASEQPAGTGPASDPESEPVVGGKKGSGFRKRMRPAM